MRRSPGRAQPAQGTPSLVAILTSYPVGPAASERKVHSKGTAMLSSG
jgi:hypothetical protein